MQELGDDSKYFFVAGERLVLLWRESLLSEAAFIEVTKLGRSNFTRLKKPGAHRVFRDTFNDMAAGLRLTTQQLLEKIGTNGLSPAPSEARTPVPVSDFVAAAPPVAEMSSLSHAVLTETVPNWQEDSGCATGSFAVQ